MQIEEFSLGDPPRSAVGDRLAEARITGQQPHRRHHRGARRRLVARGPVGGRDGGDRSWTRDAEILTGLYGIQTTSLIPERSRLEIDLDERMLGVGARRVQLGGDTVQERQVLTEYLAMVYAMRDSDPA